MLWKLNNIPKMKDMMWTGVMITWVIANTFTNMRACSVVIINTPDVSGDLSQVTWSNPWDVRCPYLSGGIVCPITKKNASKPSQYATKMNDLIVDYFEKIIIIITSLRAVSVDLNEIDSTLISHWHNLRQGRFVSPQFFLIFKIRSFCVNLLFFLLNILYLW